MLGRGARRWSVVLVLGVTPIAAIAWMGCSDDKDTPASGLGKADPGGTWGAQLAVSVVGRGKVTAAGVIDCPQERCFYTLVFPNNAADGATGGVTLTAEPTTGAKFLGWAFEPVTLGGGSRGPDTCNPVMRPATVPGVDTNALTITLPYGEVEGTSPAGHEGECAAFKKVPLAYKVVAKFSGELPEAGPDVIDGGNLEDADGGGDPAVYNVTSGSSPALLGRTSSGYIYWTYNASGYTGLSVGLSPESFSVPQSSSLVSSTLDSISKSKVEPNGVVLLDIFGDLKAVRQSSPTTLISVGSTSSLGTCQAIAMDSSSNVHCRLSTSIATWKWNGGSYDSPTQVFVNLPSGSDLAVDSSNFYYDLSSDGKIDSLPLNGTDASAPSQVISGTFGVSRLLAGSSKLAWQSGGTIEISSGKSSSSSFTSSGITTSLTGTFNGLAFDPNDSYTIYASGIYGIYRYTGAGAPQEVKTGKTFTGMAVGDNYVFYTASGDNKIYRITKPF